MSHKDTLTLYEEQIARGVPDEQARIIAHQLGNLADEFGSLTDELTRELRSLRSEMTAGFSKIDIRFIKIEKDMFWMRLIGAAMVITFFTNILSVAWLK